MREIVETLMVTFGRLFKHLSAFRASVRFGTLARPVQGASVGTSLYFAYDNKQENR